MRKFGIISFIIIAAVAFQSCNTKNKSKEIANYQATETKLQLNEVLQKKVGSWIQEGMDCYGVIIASDADGNVRGMKAVKAKVLIIQNDKIKMKALEDVSVAPKEGCSKLGISKGETWWEEDGDLFQTREQALEYIKSYKAEHKPKSGTKFTVD